MDKSIVKIATEVLKIPAEVVEQNCKELNEHQAFYFWNPTRGGIAVIVGKDGEKLAAVSGVSFEKHLKAYLEGKRN